MPKLCPYGSRNKLIYSTIKKEPLETLSALLGAKNKNREMQSYDVVKHYANFLQPINWDYFGTFTTGYKLTLPSARRSMERFIERLDQKHGGVEMFWVAEKFECKDGYHTHGLLRMKDRSLFGRNVSHVKVDGSTENTKFPDVAFPLLRECWQIVTKGGGRKYNRIELKRYNSKLGAAGYVSKYVTKELADYDINL
jgi:hypothetical protein